MRKKTTNGFELKSDDPRDELVFVMVTNPDPAEDFARFRLQYKGLGIMCSAFYTRKGILWVDFGDNVDTAGNMELINKVREILPGEVEKAKARHAQQDETPF